ncbi:cytidylate kinase family protein [Eubacterium sp. 1001713B170207_170306_E7]|uniref:cytidylate kinase family protein n=1 Tax=Eubacterium sp. 1001713B170207_170306_E7 TaxID=2787097 RepID=UPI0018983A24|nr:cytidylate kinase family protein [Eubacterium sp. 1001713B170207_170306_E7]
MTAGEKMKRYMVFTIGVLINAFGISFITKASLGTSPISSVPYVLSLRFEPTLGEFSFVLNMLFIILEIALLRRSFEKIQLLQIVVNVVFSYFIDFSMLLLGGLNPGNYAMKLVFLLVGCAILAFGITLEVFADVILVPGEGIVNAIAVTFKKPFGSVKVGFDVTLMSTACILSLVFFHGLQGIREGTLISALIVGTVVRFYSKRLAFLKDWLFGARAAAGAAADKPCRCPVITVSRQYGCGGNEVGRRLAGDLKMAFYDDEISRLTAAEGGYTNQYVEKEEQRYTNSLLYDLVASNYAMAPGEVPPLEALFEVQSRVIRALSCQGPCVIIGRCADYVLRDQPDGFHVYLSASLEDRVRRVMAKEQLDEAQARQRIAEKDRERTSHYQHFTGRTWGAAGNYSLSVDTSVFGIEGAAELIEHAFECARKGKENEPELSQPAVCQPESF